MKKSIALPALGTLLLASVAVFASAADAAVITGTTNFTTNTVVTGDAFLESATGTWNISSGVIVSATTQRFFIGSNGAPESDAVDAVFEVAGGGSLQISNTSSFTMRLGQDQTSEAGVLRISGGSTVEFTIDSNQGPFSQKSSGLIDGIGDSRIILSGLGSTFIAEGTYDSLTSVYNRGLVTTEGLFVGVEGGTISSSYDALSNRTTLTVVPEPSAMLLGALGALGLLRRRR